MSFSFQLRGFNKEVKARLERNRRQILFEVFRGIVLDTPVLEGTLRGNWQLSSSNPKLSELDVRSQQEVMAEIDAVLKGSRFGDTVWFTNNLPYAYPIEFYGWSHTKAPQGMVRKNVMRVNRIAQAIARSR